ncbi:Aste57867_23070 [Aphanomyces stellatus]|uniref:Aste57867_23070 protein n=1 Tax=Aphanomyces stellatus TaxID=120398 RepID=A0A485LLW8_9STRA|nr:hypothetical protein As57867_022999 [Aphanomyces stellatus]VFT99718.1 Aste57867_23070 [Aphanomyces stellatus]
MRRRRRGQRRMYLRNIDFAAWIKAYRTLFMNTIGNALLERPATGAPWFAYVEAHTWTSVDNQWANYRGIQETISVTNALGTTTTIQIKATPSAQFGSMWTSTTLFGSFENDMCAMTGNESLVRESGNFSVRPTRMRSKFIHDQVGWLGNFDLKFIPPPQSLLRLSMPSAVVCQLQSNSAFASTFAPLGTLLLTPPQWNDPTMAFYGGSLMCKSGVAQPYVQPSFGFDDSCSSQRPYTQVWDGLSQVFAFTALDGNRSGANAACSLCLAYQINGCLQMARIANQASSQLLIPPDAMRWIADVPRAPTPYIDSQPMVQADDPFTVFGWTAMYEWALGQREAVSFAGDFQTLRLLSYRYDPTVIYANALDVQQSLASYLVGFATSVSSGLALVAAVVILVRVIMPPGRIGSNWFVLNRVASTSWMGRPLLVVRGVCVVLCLATCPVRLYLDLRETFDAGIHESLGRGLWLTSVFNDLFFHVTNAYTRAYAPGSSLLAWIVCRHFRSLVKMDTQLLCTSGSLEIGSVRRLLLICTVQVASVVVSAVGVASIATLKPAKSFPCFRVLPWRS